MGQSNSRSSRPSSRPSPSRHADAAPVASSSSRSNGSAALSPSTSETPSAAEKKSRRRSMLSLMSRSSSASPSSSDNKDTDESPSRRHTASLRKRWQSRRFSKAHSQLDVVNEPPKESGVPESAHDLTQSEVQSVRPVETQILAGPSNSSRPSTPFPISRPTTPSLHEQQPSESQNEGLSSEERRLSENIGNWLSGSPQSTASDLYEPAPNPSGPSHPGGADIEREINEFLSSAPLSNGEDTSDMPGTGPDPLARPAESITPAQAPPRHFPPPGTLVVVQGVVNTTDAPPLGPRTANTSAPPPPPPESLLAPPPQRRSSSAPRSLRSGNGVEGSRRTGLGSLMPIRPTSMIGRRPSTSSRASNTPGLSRQNELSNPTDPVAVEHTTSSDSAGSSESSDADTVTPAESDGGNHALSPGSIDVLGTLLSVAAAATAASLFSPGFSNPGALNPGAAIPPSAGRPTSPTPTAGLGGFGGLNRLAELNLDPSGNGPRPSPTQLDPSQTDRDARDRIRGVWENFRERWGLGHRGATQNADSVVSGPVGGSVQGGATDSTPPQNPRMRPGELMLAEMARALNAGLGLAGSTERRTSTEQSTPSGEDQANATTPSSHSSDAEDRPRPLSPDPGFEAFLTSLQADLRTVLSGNLAAASDGADEPQHHTFGSETSRSEGPQHEADVPADVLPFADDTDSDLESVVEDVAPTTTFAGQPGYRARTATPIPPASTLPQMPSPDNEEQNPPAGDRQQPAINLWRVYRFAPIPTPPGHALRMSTLPLPENAQATPGSSVPPVAVPPGGPSGASLTDPTPSAEPEQQPFVPTSAAPVDLNIVVPVIVVGLQSVDAAPDRADLEDGPVMPHDDLHRHDDPFDSAEDFGVPAHDVATGGRPATPRGRTWQSRAANALRGLRPGRRNGSRGRRASENAGSRTFLIYVIGGYYPPNHHVVTGSDSLDSYEALWELADLLGQVKPPVATQEDIEKSGLEIVKAREMKEHEHNGRIASNCMDRCLICLDDYEPEQDVRVMSCRHAFHKDCVDKWLQVGRNNCPACRSKGVSTSNDATPVPPPSAAPIV